MKLLLKIFTILIFGIVFNTKASVVSYDQAKLERNQQQEFKKVQTCGTSAAFLESSRVSFPVHSQTLPVSTSVLFTFISFIGFAGIGADSFYQKKIKVLRQRWLWLILFPFHSFY
ncbi:hypothetical protein [Pedobacter arcticus]|uniref:hypothetical protein n=1 Tax=Pedobacter arcticus TaxID=752140 RepID=UPI0002F0B2DD|nr:hypothetical protein [Pedobacter arcticus]